MEKTSWLRKPASKTEKLFAKLFIFVSPEFDPVQVLQPSLVLSNFHPTRRYLSSRLRPVHLESHTAFHFI